MRIAALLTVALLLAGCSDAPAVSTDTPDGPAPPTATVTKTTGAISGVVVDVTVTPVAGATIAMKGAGKNTTADANGGFLFEGLEPATYFLDVTAPGFGAVQVSATVVAGEVTKTRVQLEAVEVLMPVYSTLKHDGFIEFSGGITGTLANVILRDLPGGNPLCDCAMQFSTAGQDVKTLVVEALWTDTLPLPTGPSDLYLEVAPEELDDGTDDIQGGYLTSPILKHYPIELWGEDETNEEWQAALSGGGFSIQYQQDYQMFVTVFSNFPAPQGWSFINGDR